VLSLINALINAMSARKGMSCNESAVSRSGSAFDGQLVLLCGAAFCVLRFKRTGPL